MPVRAFCLFVLAAVLGTLVAPAVRAQGPLFYEAFGQAEGLPLPNVHALAQDTAGFLWVGTEGGLMRYDGREFRPFRSLPDDPASLATGFVHSLLAAPDGGLWVGTYGGGLDRYRPQTGTFAHLLSSPTGNDDAVVRIRALAPATGGGVWAGTGSGLVLRVDEAGRRREAFATPSDVPGDEVSAVLEVGGVLWIGRSSGLYRAVRGRQERLSLRGPAFALLRTRDGHVLAGTVEGLFRLDGTTATRVAADPTVFSASHPVYALAEAPDGAVWVGSAPGPAVLPRGASRYALDPSVTSGDASAGVLAESRIYALFFDRDGTLWIGTEAHGLFKRNTPRVAFVGDKTLPNPDVSALLEAPRGVLWIGTYGGLVRYDLATRQGVPVGGTAFANGIRGLALAPDGKLYVGTRSDGLWTYDPETGVGARFRALPGTPVPVGISQVRANPRGRPWLAASTGVCTVAPSGRRLVCVKEGLPGPAYATYEDRQGRLWMSFWGGGIVRFDPKTKAVRRYVHLENTAGTLPSNNVSTFQEDASGVLWIATYGAGIGRFDEQQGTFSVVDERHGLPSPIVFALVPDGDDLWLSTSNGLARYTPATGAVRLFDRRDGLQGDEFNANAALRLSDGRLAFGGISGLNVVDPARLDLGRSAPRVRLTALRVRNRPYDGVLAALDVLRLPMRENFLAFEFAALDFAAPSRNRYAYRMEGLEDRWSPATPDPSATYTDLRPGRYTFRVRAAGADGVWNDDAFALPVEIVPPFWRTLWFRVLAALAALLGVAYAARTVSTRRLRAQMAALEAEQRVQAERVRIARDLHDHVGAQLANVISVADLLRQHAQGGDPDDIDRFALALDHDARETMQQLRRTIWATSSHHVSVLALFEQLDQYARHLMRFRAEPRLFTRLAEADDATPASDRFLRPVQGLHLLRIAQEALTNTLKHAGASRIDLTLDVAADALTLRIHDDGTFKPPGTGTGAASLGASGFGLAGMRARADEMGAALAAGPHPDGGTCVTVVLALDALALDPAPASAVAPERLAPP